MKLHAVCQITQLGEECRMSRDISSEVVDDIESDS
jgi:hypothetical protein